MGADPHLGPWTPNSAQPCKALSEERESLVRQKSRSHGADSWLETVTGLF